jgi:hypothetical protein
MFLFVTRLFLDNDILLAQSKKSCKLTGITTRQGTLTDNGESEAETYDRFEYNREGRLSHRYNSNDKGSGEEIYEYLYKNNKLDFVYQTNRGYVPHREDTLEILYNDAGQVYLICNFGYTYRNTGNGFVKDKDCQLFKFNYHRSFLMSVLFQNYQMMLNEEVKEYELVTNPDGYIIEINSKTNGENVVRYKRDANNRIILIEVFSNGKYRKVMSKSYPINVTLPNYKKFRELEKIDGFDGFLENGIQFFEMAEPSNEITFDENGNKSQVTSVTIDKVGSTGCIKAVKSVIVDNPNGNKETYQNYVMYKYE